MITWSHFLTLILWKKQIRNRNKTKQSIKQQLSSLPINNKISVKYSSTAHPLYVAWQGCSIKCLLLGGQINKICFADGLLNLFFFFLTNRILHKLFMKKGRNEDKKDWKQRREDFDNCLLGIRLVEGFIEAAPQLLLQLYIMTISSSWLTGNSFKI